MLNNIKHRKKAVLLLVMIVSMMFGLLDTRDPTMFSVSGYNVYQDNAVDSDSDIDAVVNIGDDGATSYTNAQTLDNDDQIITEGNGAGYVAGSDEDELHDAITDTDSGTNPDTGTYSNDANMLADDGTMNTLTEADTAGSGGTAEYSPTAHSGSVSALTSPTLAYDGSLTTYAYGAVGLEDGTPRFSLDTWSTSTGTITQVDIVVRIAVALQSNDLYGMYWKTGASADQTLWAMGSTARTLANYTFSNIAEPTDGTWTWSEITAFSLFWNTDKVQGSDNADIEVYEAVLIITTSATANYEFDREFQFSSIATSDGDTETLAINTGTIGTESLIVQIWEASSWTTVVTIVDANDNTWINTSIATWMDATTEYFRFLGGTETTDTTQNTWEIDMVLIHNIKNEVLDYELQWEHQSVSVDQFKDDYALTIYGASTENVEIQTWDIGGTTWNTALTTQIGVTEQWYNQSIDVNAIGSTITWRYKGTSEIGDTSQSTLNIDFAGISSWNFTVTIVEASFDIPSYDQGSGATPFPENPLRANVTSGVDYDIQIRGTDGTGSPITAEYILFDTDSDPSGAIVLTSVYQDVFTSLPAGDMIISNFYVFLIVPFGIDDGSYTFTLEIQIVAV